MEKHIKKALSEEESKAKRDVPTYRVVYLYDKEKELIESVKICFCPPSRVRTLTELASIHVPAMTAFRRQHPTQFNRVTLPIDSFDVEFQIVDKVRE